MINYNIFCKYHTVQFSKNKFSIALRNTINNKSDVIDLKSNNNQYNPELYPLFFRFSIDSRQNKNTSIY